MTTDFDGANKDVTTLYKQISPMVEEIISKHSKDVDVIITKIKSNLTNLTNKELQNYILELSVEAYYLANTKDLSILKQECALTLMKESQANIYNGTAGTQATRNNQSIIDTGDKQCVTMLYNAVSNRMKSKLDEVHRMIGVLTNVLISKNAEAKIRGGNVDDDLHANNV